MPFTEEEVIRALYAAALGREPDPPGLRAHTSLLTENPNTLPDIAKTMFKSEEHQRLIERSTRGHDTLLRGLKTVAPSESLVPIMWSEPRIQQLERDYDEALRNNSSITATLLLAQLQAARGRLEAAKSLIEGILSAEEGVLKTEAASVMLELFVTLFIVQLFDELSELLRRWFAMPGEVRVTLGASIVEHWGLRWQVAANSHTQFGFDESILQRDDTKSLLWRFFVIFPIFSRYLREEMVEPGIVTISFGDENLPQGLGFCSSTQDSFLIPDNYFMESRGYQSARDNFSKVTIPWKDREQVAFWRGSTSGDPEQRSELWRELPRVKLCALARSNAASGLIDASITNIVQIPSSVAVDEVVKSGYIGDYVPVHEFQKWRYQIDIDGNTNSWPGLFVKLLSGSTVLKVESPRGYRQWYYQKLVPWINFVPVAADLSNLVDRIRWLRANDNAAREIGRQGRMLAEAMDYESELRAAAIQIKAAFRLSQTSVGPEGGFLLADMADGGTPSITHCTADPISQLADVRSVKQKLDELEAGNARLEREKLEYLRDTEELRAENARLEREKLGYLRDTEELRAENARLEREKLDYLRDTEELRAENARLERDKLDYLKDIEELRAENARLERNKLDYLKDIEELTRAHAALKLDVTTNVRQSVGGAGALPHRARLGRFIVSWGGGELRFRIGWPRPKGDALRLADQARDKRMWSQASELYRKVLDEQPGNAPIWVQYGHALKESGRIEEAERAYFRGVTLDTSSADAHLQWGRALRLLGRKEEATAEYLTAIALSPCALSATSELLALGWTQNQILAIR